MSNDNPRQSPAAEKTRLYLIRHGETEENRRGILVGSTDVPLSETGREQASSLAQLARSLPVDAVYASPLQRAVETALLVFGKEARILTDSRLKEMHFGEWEGLPFAEIAGRYPEAWSQWLKDWENSPIPGADEFRAFAVRLLGCCEEILQAHEGGSVAIVSHGGCLRTLFAHYFSGAPGAGYWQFKVENAALSEIEFANGLPILTCFNHR